MTTVTEARIRHVASWVLAGVAVAELAVVGPVRADLAGLTGFAAVMLAVAALWCAIFSIVGTWREMAA